MQGFFARVFLVLLALAGPVSAQDIVLSMSKNEIGITAFFNGSEILIFGALKHETVTSSAGDLDVVVTIASPRDPVTVRRKDKRLGIWVNVEAFDVDLAPSFYAVATTGPFDQVVSEASDLWHQISVRQLIPCSDSPPPAPTIKINLPKLWCACAKSRVFIKCCLVRCGCKSKLCFRPLFPCHQIWLRAPIWRVFSSCATARLCRSIRRQLMCRRLASSVGCIIWLTSAQLFMGSFHWSLPFFLAGLRLRLFGFCAAETGRAPQADGSWRPQQYGPAQPPHGRPGPRWCALPA